MSKRFIVRVLLATCLALLTVLSLAPGVFAQTSSNGQPLSEKNTPSWLQWHIVASSNAGPQNELTAIAALSGKDAWTVGDYHAPTPSLSKTLTEHWNGSKWKVVSSPNVGVADHLYGVAMAASDDVWAVGNSFNSHDVGFTLILHWNGISWRVAKSPSTGAPSGTSLYAVSAIASNDVWAVGQVSKQGIFQTLTEHWNGKNWSTITSPNLGTGNNTLYGISALTSDDVWAVGVSDAGSLAEHWNGKTWQLIPSPVFGGAANILLAVSAIATNDVWAVGNYNGTALTEHWNGKNWSIIPSPNVPNKFNFLLGVVAVSSQNVWAVGYSYNESTPNRTLILHWNGKHWRVVPSPNASLDWSTLYAVIAIPGGPATAVGYYFDTSDTTKTLVEASR